MVGLSVVSHPHPSVGGGDMTQVDTVLWPKNEINLSMAKWILYSDWYSHVGREKFDFHWSCWSWEDVGSLPLEQSLLRNVTKQRQAEAKERWLIGGTCVLWDNDLTTWFRFLNLTVPRFLIPWLYEPMNSHFAWAYLGWIYVSRNSKRLD